VKESLPGFERSLPSPKNSLRDVDTFPAFPAQGMRLKPLQPLREAAFESPDRVAIRRNSLPNSLRTGNGAGLRV
jgi:hypothetical protein